LKLKLASGDTAGSGDTVDVDGIRIVTRIAAGLSIPELRNLSEHAPFETEERRCVGWHIERREDRGRAAVTPDLTARISASSIATRIGKALGEAGVEGRTGAGGGKNEALLPGALKEGEAAVRELLRAGSP